MVPFRYNLRSLFVRKVTTIATAGGIALVVFVFAASLMLNEGVKRALETGGRPDTVIVLRKGSDSELSSGIQNELVNLLRGRPELAPGEGNVIGEIVIVITADILDGGSTNVLIRGTPPDGYKFRPEVKIESGRMPTPGTDEVMIGVGIADRFKNMSVGEQFDVRRNRPLKIVGTFSADGTSYESEVWGDRDTIRKYLGREAVVSSVRMRLASAGQFDALRAGLDADKQTNLKAFREADYYKKSADQTSGFLTGMGIGFAILFSIAAMLGAAITMNSAIANRQREIGTLRALGFSRLAILTSFLLEALVLAIAGGALGTILVMVLTFFTFPVLNFATFSEIVITFTASPGVVITSLIFSSVMGLVGGLVPAIRAARISPVEAMRG